MYQKPTPEEQQKMNEAYDKMMAEAAAQMGEELIQKYMKKYGWTNRD